MTANVSKRALGVSKTPAKRHRRQSPWRSLPKQPEIGCVVLGECLFRVEKCLVPRERDPVRRRLCDVQFAGGGCAKSVFIINHVRTHPASSIIEDEVVRSIIVQNGTSALKIHDCDGCRCLRCQTFDAKIPRRGWIREIGRAHV